MKRPQQPPETIVHREKRDKVAGFVLFIIVNVILLLLFSGTRLQNADSASGIPWLVNGCLLLAAFIVRPQLAIGYLACPFILAMLAAVLGVLAVASCVVSLVSAVVLGDLAVLVFAVLMLFGLYKGLRWASGWWNNWWSEGQYEAAHYVSLVQQTSDRELLEGLDRGDFEIGDDGEIRPAKRSSDNK